MHSILITLRGIDNLNQYNLALTPDTKILDFRLNAQTLLGFDDEDCRLVVERTSENLSDSFLVQDADIKDGDILQLLPPAGYNLAVNPDTTASSRSKSSRVNTHSKKAANTTVSYKLILTVNGKQKNIWEHSIELLSHHENNPSRFFDESDKREIQILEDFLEVALERKPSPFELRKVLQVWIDDIQLGYRKTFTELKR